MTTGIYDAHSHFIMSEYFEEVRNNWFAEDTVPLPTGWSPEKHLEYMDQSGIDWSLLFLSSPHPHYKNDRRCIELMRSMNEKLAGIKRTWPDRFGFAAALPHPNNDAAVEEAVYALDILGADAIKLASNSRGLYMGDRHMEPLFAELDKRSAVVVMHPHRPSQLDEGVRTADFVPAFEFLCDTTRAVLNMVFNGVLQRYPGIKLVVPHNGSFLPNIYDRIKMTAIQFAELGKIEPVDVDESFSRIYYDTSGHTDPNTEFLLTLADPTHIMFGSDYPFGPKNAAAANLKKTVDYFRSNKKIAPYAELILSENCRRLYDLPIR